eukprot:COSAG02_NODE_6879_length_3312_cov_9.135699_2_plen_261_part_00
MLTRLCMHVGWQDQLVACANVGCPDENVLTSQLSNLCVGCLLNQPGGVNQERIEPCLSGCGTSPIPFTVTDPSPECTGQGHPGGAGFVQACRGEVGCDYLDGQCTMIPISGYEPMSHSDVQTVPCNSWRAGLLGDITLTCNAGVVEILNNTCTAPTTCADTNADGTADDPYDCSANVNYIDASPANITCASISCTATECCTVIPWDRSGTETIALHSTIVVQGDLANIGSSNMREEFELAFGTLALQFIPCCLGSMHWPS